MPEPAEPARHFLGASSPALPAAADWLIDELAGDDADLGETLVVVPGARAQRRLVELLAERSAGRALVPPTVVTLGKLADRLLTADQTPVANDLASLLAWASALRGARAERVADLTPHPPGRDDWPGWWSLAEQVRRAADELGAQLLRLQDVPDRLGHRGDEARWQVLAELERAADALLAEQGLADKHLTRRDAIEAGRCSHAGPIVLLATVDLQPVHERMLACVDSPVHALVFADAQDAEGFDAFGGLVEAYWNERAIDLDDAAIVYADRPTDQAAAVLDAVRCWSRASPTSADQVTVGLGDASLDGPIARTLALAGLPVRSAGGAAMARSRPVLLLVALAEFAQGQRFDQLAHLLRHPDAEAYVARVAGVSTRSWLTLLDRYATEHLAARSAAGPGGWLGDAAQVEALDAAYRAAAALLPEPAGALRPLNARARAIGGALARVYGGRRLSRYAEGDRTVVAALEAVGGELERLASLDGPAVPHCTFAQAATLIVSRLAGQVIPEPGGEPAIELVGYLELLLDDAPRLVVAGMNEQHVPAPPRNSPLLNEGVRNALGLPGDAHRLARDGYALSVMLACRDDARVIAGRRSLDGDPLLPSRLLLRTDDDTMTRRVLDFVDPQERPPAAPLLLTPGGRDRFLIARPVLPDPPITSLRVTAFRDYLACPYRFYLKHVLRLDALGDRAVELDARGFGTLAHEALRVLAGDDMAGTTDEQAIADRLGMALDRAFARRYGGDPPVAARVQLEQLRYRLESFAPLHAAHAAAGWRIEHRELSRDTTVHVDGEPFTITGQVDRIDRHADGRWRVIDYKTSDTAKTPEQTHRKTIDGQRRWVDLQLPLYLDLCAKLGVDASAEVGYLNLPKKSADTAFVAADWSADELAVAREQRDFVIRQVRAGVFWPPKLPPVFDDGLRGLCADRAMDREALIRASAAAGGVPGA